MTYCVAICLDEGIVLAADSRTHAGIDQVSTYSKMYRCATADDRSLVILMAGNLATTQSVIDRVERDLREDKNRNINSINYLSDIADYLGDILKARIGRHSSGAPSHFSPDASLILAGQIWGELPQALLIYPEGNHISTSRETPYLQIGESKYGKPVLDRFLSRKTSLADAATCALISMDSTMKSNASVGPPIEVLCYTKDHLLDKQHHVFNADDPYLAVIRNTWENQLHKVFSMMPPLPKPR